MFSRLRPLENRERQQSLMLLNLLVRSYQRMTNRSIVSKWSCLKSSGIDESNPKMAVTDGQMFHKSKADIFLFPEKADTVSHPVKAWKNVRAQHFSSPRLTAI